MERALRFSDAVIVEVASSAAGEPVAGAASVSRRFEDVTAEVAKVIKPLAANVMQALDERVESCELELAFSFTAEGSLFLCKASGETSVTVKLKIKGPQ